MSFRRIIVSLASVLAASAVSCSSVVTTGVRSDTRPQHGLVVVWGNHAAAVAATMGWLQGRGVEVLDGLTLLPVGSSTSTTPVLGEGTLLDVARVRGVPEIVFVTYAGDARAPIVTVRSVEVGTGQVRWTGTARVPSYRPHPLPDSLVTLTCHALATAWGLEGQGRQWLAWNRQICQSQDH